MVKLGSSSFRRRYSSDSVYVCQHEYDCFDYCSSERILGGGTWQAVTLLRGVFFFSSKNHKVMESLQETFSVDCLCMGELIVASRELGMVRGKYAFMGGGLVV